MVEEGETQQGLSEQRKSRIYEWPIPKSIIDKKLKPGDEIVFKEVESFNELVSGLGDVLIDRRLRKLGSQQRLGWKIYRFFNSPPRLSERMVQGGLEVVNPRAIIVPSTSEFARSFQALVEVGKKQEELIKAGLLCTVFLVEGRRPQEIAAYRRVDEIKGVPTPKMLIAEP